MIAPAIHLPGNCAEAIALYQKAFHATVHSIAYDRDAPGSETATTAGTPDSVLHAELTICGSRVNMSDTQENVIAGNGIVLNAFLDSADAVRTAFHALSDGGKILVELGPQFFSPLYGSVEDRFGIRWQIMVE